MQIGIQHVPFGYMVGMYLLQSVLEYRRSSLAQHTQDDVTSNKLLHNSTSQVARKSLKHHHVKTTNDSKSQDGRLNRPLRVRTPSSSLMMELFAARRSTLFPRRNGALYTRDQSLRRTYVARFAPPTMHTPGCSHCCHLHDIARFLGTASFCILTFCPASTLTSFDDIRVASSILGLSPNINAMSPAGRSPPDP